MTRVVIVDDNPNDRLLARRALARVFDPLDVVEVGERGALDAALAAPGVDLVVTDYQLRWSTGLDVLRAAKQVAPERPVIMFTNTGTEEVAVEGMRSGLDDYVLKAPKHYARLATAARGALERAAARREAARLEQRLRDLLERLEVGVFRADRAGRVIEANAALLRLLGVASAADVPPGAILELSGAAAREAPWRQLDGTTRWVRVVVRRVDEDPTLIEGIVEDVTERQRAEVERANALAREREARQQAEAANRLKDEFLATLSHELRTPLNAVLGWAQMLRTQAQGASGPAERGLAAIERNARAQALLIEDLLDVSRIVTGKLRVEPADVDASSLVSSAVEAARPSADAKGVALEADLDPGAGLVRVDSDRFRQVLANLLSNAVKFTPAGGRVSVSARREDDRVVVRVADTGIGIDEAFLPHVFDRFRQADQSPTREYGGLGLGLSIARHVVELHGGTIEARSAGAGQGATFVVTLPAASEGAPGAARSSAPPALACPPDLAGLRVLVVDDDPDARQVVDAMLTHCRARVSTAASASEALAMIERDPPDAIVSDIGMPGGDGLGLIRDLRARPAERGGRAAAVALTAHARAEDRAVVLAAGFDAWVRKPVDASDLLDALAGAVRARSS